MRAANLCLQILRDVAFDQHLRVPEFVAAEDLGGGDGTHLLALAGGFVDTYAHEARLSVALARKTVEPNERLGVHFSRVQLA